MFENFKQLVQIRQACRNFNDKPIDKKELLEIAKLAMLTPSACNSQPWKMYVVTDAEKVETVAKSVQEGGRNPFASGAKAFIVICEKCASLRPEAEVRFGKNHFVKYDVGELIAYLTLGAKAKGIDSCIIGWINQEMLKTAVDIKDDEICNIVVAFGYSDISVRDKTRKAQEEVIVEL